MLSGGRALKSAFVLLGVLYAAVAGAVPREDCFSFEKLPPRLAQKAETMLLRALDREGLYSLASTLKPWSSDIHPFQVPVAELPTSEELGELKQIIEQFRCGDAAGELMFFEATHEGVQYGDVVMTRPSLMLEVLSKHEALFEQVGVTAASSCESLMASVDGAEPLLRLRAYGLLFGYPEYSVDFFVESERQELLTGKFVARDFYQIPTYEALRSGLGWFVWAVPQGHVPTAEDLGIRARAETTLRRYQELRARFVDAQGRGALRLIREWFHDGNGDYDPRHARLN